MRFIVGLTGASGAIYGLRLAEELLKKGHEIHFVISEAGWRVLKEEMDWDVTSRKEALARYFELYTNWEFHPNKDIGASIASGSFLVSAMIIVPCSMGTVSAIAQASSQTLLTRAADVMLKEKRQLIIVPRETPLHAKHLENMLTCCNLGAQIIPAMPAFYQKPHTLDEIVSFMVGKILDQLHMSHELFQRWGEKYD